ncbi:cytochrome P450 family protein [Parasphingorhabdus pacifica]
MSLPESALPDDHVVFDRDFAQDPHLRFALMRDETPARRVVTSSGLPGWVLTRYDDVRAALSDSRISKDVGRLREVIRERRLPGVGDRMIDQSLSFHMLNADPPDHTRLRKLVVKAFTPGRIESMGPRVEQITDDLLDAMDGRSEVDLLDEFAFPLPITVIADLLGVDEDRREEFRAWSKVLLDDGVSEAAAEALRQTTEYLSGLVAKKREQPGDDLLSALVEASEDEDRLDENELLAMAFLLLVAGHETTVNLLANSVHALLRNPEQLAKLRADPGFVPAAVEETLRFDSPVMNATVRHTTEPVRFGEVEVPARSVVWLSLGAANRDAERFTDPNSFDVSRDTSGHLAFGHGIHFCVGASLARLEGRIGLRKLIDRFPNLRAVETQRGLTWRSSTLIRGLERFPVRLD